MHTILFICTGNTCRSPMAEAIAQHWADREEREGNERLLMASAGTSALPGMPRSPEVLRSLGEIPVDGRSKQITADMIRNARFVFAMTPVHVEAARALVASEPKQQEKIQLLDPEGPVEDPVGLGQDVYDRLATRFKELIPRRLREVFDHEDSAGVGSSRG